MLQLCMGVASRKFCDDGGSGRVSLLTRFVTLRLRHHFKYRAIPSVPAGTEGRFAWKYFSTKLKIYKKNTASTSA